MSQNFTKLQISKDSSGKTDTTLVISLNTEQTRIFRNYLIDLEYTAELNKINEQKIVTLINSNTELERMSKLWEATANAQATKAENTQKAMQELIATQDKKDNLYNEQIINSHKEGKKKGFKTGTAVGAAIMVIVCLLIN